MWLLNNDHEYMTDALARLATCINGKNFEARKTRFREMVNQGLFKATRRGDRNAHDRFVPTLKVGATLSAVYPCGLACFNK